MTLFSLLSTVTTLALKNTSINFFASIQNSEGTKDSGS